jgi:hypothetical protein
VGHPISHQKTLQQLPLKQLLIFGDNDAVTPTFLLTLLAGIFLIQNEPLRTPATVSGRVVSDSNTPLQQVRVSRSWSPREKIVLTDVNGQFTITTDTPLDRHFGKAIVRFSREGYQPATRVLPLNSSDSPIMLNEAADSPRNVPACPATTPRFGLGVIGYTLPPKTKTKHYGGDALTEVIQFRKYTMGHSWGLNWSQGFPIQPAFYEKVSQISERDLTFGNSVGAEYRGTRPDGTYFRWIGTLFETLAYDHVPKDAAMFFDRVIDSLCSTH